MEIKNDSPLSFHDIVLYCIVPCTRNKQSNNSVFQQQFFVSICFSSSASSSIPSHSILRTVLYRTTYCTSGLGTHISRVRSVKMDSWSDPQLARMKIGGNRQCRDFLTGHDGGLESSSFDKKTIRDRYDSPAAVLYKSVLDARLEGSPEPTQLLLPDDEQPRAPKNNNGGVKRKMEGFGSSPPPPPPPKHHGMKLGAYVVAAGFVAWYILKAIDNKK
jgi:Putative GTPase activating protein for Arf